MLEGLVNLLLACKLLIKKRGGISGPEQECLQHGPNRLVAPVLAQDISGIDAPRDVAKGDNFCCNGLTDSMV